MSGTKVASRTMGTAAVLVMTIVAVVGWAHQTAESQHQVEVRPAQGEIEQLLSIAAEDLAHHLGHIDHGQRLRPMLLDEIREEVGDYIDDHTGIRADGEDCRLEQSEFIYYPAEDGRVHRYQKWDCPAEPDELEFANQVMLDGHAGYRHTARIQVGDDIFFKVFDENYPTAAVYPSPATESAPDESGEESDAEGVVERHRQQQQPDQQGGDTGGMVALVGLIVVFIVTVMVFRRR